MGILIIIVWRTLLFQMAGIGEMDKCHNFYVNKRRFSGMSFPGYLVPRQCLRSRVENIQQGCK